MKLTPIRTALLLSLSAASFSAVAHPNSIGHAYDSQNVVVRDNFGNCVRTAEWTKENAIAECGGAAAEKPAAAPVAATPAAAPAPVIAVPKPAPIPAPAPIKIDLSADNSFDSAKSVLKPEGQATLNKLVADLNGVTYERITLTGHAERKGSATVNQKLSVDRANSV
jgi:OOP family OmpA-OmpF porin